MDGAYPDSRALLAIIDTRIFLRICGCSMVSSRWKDDGRLSAWVSISKEQGSDPPPSHIAPGTVRFFPYQGTWVACPSLQTAGQLSVPGRCSVTKPSCRPTPLHASSAIHRDYLQDVPGHGQAGQMPDCKSVRNMSPSPNPSSFHHLVPPLLGRPGNIPAASMDLIFRIHLTIASCVRKSPELGNQQEYANLSPQNLASPLGVH